MLKKIMAAAETKEEMTQLTKDIQKLKNKGYKSRYLALHLLVEYINPIEYIKENPQTIKDVIRSTTETLQNGKYVLNFFEALLKKALGRTEESERGKLQ